MRRASKEAFTPAFQGAADLLASRLTKGGLAITLGCGNIYMLDEMLA